MDFSRIVGTAVIAACIAAAGSACDDAGESEAETTEATEAEGEGADEGAEEGASPEAEEGPEPGEVVLEEVDVEGLGTVKLPKGYEETTPPTDESGHYRFPLSEDGFESMNIDWESSGGATTIEEGEKLIGVLIGNGEVKSKEDLEDGRVKFVASRDDGTTWTVVFNADSYLKCWGPEEQADNCAEIAESLDPVDG